MAPATCYVREQLGGGRPVQIRALRPLDEADLLVAIDRTGTEHLQRRFFVTKRGFSIMEKAFFMKIDFANHVTLVATIKEDDRPAIVGGGRYIVTKSGHAEVAFMVVEAYQGQGIEAILTRHLVEIARAARLKQLAAHVQPENIAMLKVLEKLGFQIAPSLDPRILHLALSLV